MTRKHLFMLALIGISSWLTSCKKLVGTGPAISQTRTESGFTGINLDIDATLNITQDSVYQIEVIAQQNILDIIRTRVDGNNLCVSYKPKLFVKPTETVIVNVHTPSLSSLDISGSGKINTLNAITTNDMDIDVSGSGKINIISLTAQNIDTKISGSGKININAGSSNTLESQISGSGDLDALYLQSKDVNTNTSGSGTTKVFATQHLNARISGSGNVYYRGNPTVDSDISGSGKVIHQN